MAANIHIVKPQQTTNRLSNPSFETALDGVESPAGTLTQDNTRAIAGRYSLKAAWASAPTGALRSIDVELAHTEDEVYTVSAWVYIDTDLGTSVQILEDTSSRPAYVTLENIERPVGEWFRTSITYQAVGSSGWFRLAFVVPIGTAFNVWVDAILHEEADTAAYNAGDVMQPPSVYVDGDQPECVWLGAPHESKSRSPKFSRMYGQILDIEDDLGFQVRDGMQGLYMPRIDLSSYARAFQDGEGVSDRYVLPRNMSMDLTVQSNSDATFVASVAALIQAINPDLSRRGRSQPMRLRFDLDYMAHPMDVYAHYTGGLESMLDPNLPAGRNISFKMVGLDPFFYGVETHTADLTARITGAESHLFARIDGSWESLPVQSGGSVTAINKIVFNPFDGYVYIGGNFTNFDGISDADGIVKYDPQNQTYSALPAGVADGEVQDIVLAGSYVLIAGNFSQMSGVSNTRSIAAYQWTTDTVTAVGPGLPGSPAQVFECRVAIANNGIVYIAETVTDTGVGVAKVDVYSYDYQTSTATSLGSIDASSTTDICYDVTVADNGSVWFGGSLSETPTGASIAGVAVYYPGDDAWGGLADTGSGPVNAISRIRAGYMALGLGGALGGSNPSSGILISNGNFLQLPPGDEEISGNVTALDYQPDLDVAYVGYQSGSSIALRGPHPSAWEPPETSLYEYRNFQFSPVDIIVNERINTIEALPTGDLYIGLEDGAVPEASAVTTVTYNGTASVSPEVVIKLESGGSISGIQIYHQELDLTIASRTLQLSEEEVVVVNLATGNATSNLRGDIGGVFDIGQSLSDFVLKPGQNTIRVFVPNAPSSSSVLDIYFRWKDKYWGISGGSA